uniref:Uncharacterized protein n=1 Tax=Opuntia streptacantha TaxID=393608 RepID=A0A7C9A0H7_OPUST
MLSSSESSKGFKEMVGSLLKIDKAHEPELMIVYRGHLNVPLLRIVFHGDGVDCAYLCQRYIHLVIAPSLLSRRGHEGKGTVTTKTNPEVGQVERARNGSCGGGQVASKGLFKLLIRLSLKDLLEKSLKPSLRKRLGCQINLPPCCLCHRWPRFQVVPDVTGEGLGLVAPGGEGMNDGLQGVIAGGFLQGGVHQVGLVMVVLPLLLLRLPQSGLLIVRVSRGLRRCPHHVSSPLVSLCLFSHICFCFAFLCFACAFQKHGRLELELDTTDSDNRDSIWPETDYEKPTLDASRVVFLPLLLSYATTAILF